MSHAPDLTLTRDTPWEADRTLLTLAPSALRKEVYILRRTGALASAQAEQLYDLVERQRDEIERLRRDGDGVGAGGTGDDERVKGLVERALKECGELSDVNERLGKRVRVWKERALRAERELGKVKGGGRDGHRRVLRSARRIREVKRDVEEVIRLQKGEPVLRSVGVRVEERWGTKRKNGEKTNAGMLLRREIRQLREELFVKNDDDVR